MATDPKCRLRLTILLSGRGSTLANLLERIGRGGLSGTRVVQVISSRGEAGGLAIAREAQIPTQVVSPKAFDHIDAFSAALALAIGKTPTDLVLMAGFLSLWRIPPAWAGRVLNIHPSLLPAFGGRGLYGRRVHEAVLRAGVAESGCSVHVADNEYDHGPVVARRRVPVQPGDTPETLGARVQAAERELYPAVLERIAARGLEWIDEAVAAGGVEL